MLDSAISHAKELFALIVMIGGGIGSFVQWRTTQRKSSARLYEQLEDLKKKVIAQIAREVASAEELAEKQRIIDGLRHHCSDCYKSYLEKYAPEK